jgi:YcaO-like protein with predicted kinase domain
VSAVAKGYVHGTHRTVPPAETLRRVTPLLARYGVTRVADVTGLDDIALPTFCAIRPRGIVMQVSNGKGLRAIDAKVSAVMESLELSVAESPPTNLRRATYEEIRQEGHARAPSDMPGFVGDPARAARMPLHWVRGEELPSRTPVWLPASAAYYLQPTTSAWSSNGLASGNTLDEATAHALFEVYERHALSTLCDERGNCDFGTMQVPSLADAPGAALAELRALVDAARVRFVLMRVPGKGKIHCFGAVLLDPAAFAASTAVNLGYGAHLSPEVAAVRAITEAVQQRLTFIHGSREDLKPLGYSKGTKERVHDFFAAFEPNARWEDLTDNSSSTLAGDLALACEALLEAGLGPIDRVELSPDASPAVVVKAIVGGARMDLVRG